VITVDETRKRFVLAHCGGGRLAGLHRRPVDQRIRTPPALPRSSKSRRNDRCSCLTAIRQQGRRRFCPLPEVAAAALATDDVIRAASRAADIAPGDPALSEAADASNCIAR
jgi:hypothetical protein